MIRIAFTLIGGRSWTGGYNYLLNFLKVIIKYYPEDLKPVLFLGTDVDPIDSAPFFSIKGLEIVISPLMNARLNSISLLFSLLVGSNLLTMRLFKRHRINIVFESAQFHGVRLGIPVIAWIPDFQHRKLPHLFTYFAWWRRELGFRMQITAGRSIMLSSEDARKDCEFYYPTTIGRTSVVRFAVPPIVRPDAKAIRAVCEFYKLPKRYFYLPNQFWRHKNHLLVINALTLLKKEGYLITVVASGRQLDPNKPSYFDSLISNLRTADLVDQFLLLGLIPYEHVAPLMVGSIALLNPSLFEGWSTTVEEARALHVPMILSDLSVHKEQAAGMAHFFDRNSAKSLADTLLEFWERKNFVIASNSVPSSEPKDPARRFADDFFHLAKHIQVQKLIKR